MKWNTESQQWNHAVSWLVHDNEQMSLPRTLRNILLLFYMSWNVKMGQSVYVWNTLLILWFFMLSKDLWESVYAVERRSVQTVSQNCRLLSYWQTQLPPPHQARLGKTFTVERLLCKDGNMSVFRERQAKSWHPHCSVSDWRDGSFRAEEFSDPEIYIADLRAY